MNVHDLLGKLQGVKETTRGKVWQCKCPSHDDRQASLSVTLGDGDIILLHCHAHCETDVICDRLGIKSKDLFPDRKPKAREVAAYDYQDASGRLLFQTVRFEPKTFRQRRPDGNGGWAWNLGKTQTVLYRLPQVLAAVELEAPIIFCEGEKDADNVWNKLGIESTTTPMGAGKWKQRYGEYLQNAKIIIVPDNDDPGRQHADLVAESLQGIAQAVRVVNLPGLPIKGDISDWIAAGGTREELFALAKQTPNWTPPDKPVEIIRLTGTDFTDTGNARRMIAKYEGDIYFNRNTGKWMVWNGEFWCPDEDGAVYRKAQATVEGMRDLIGRIPHEQEAKLLTHVNKSLNASKLESMIRLATKIEGVTRTSPDFDAQPYYLCVQNGVIDLQTGKRLPFDRSLMLSRQVNIHYDEAAECPRWEQFMEEVQPDPDVCAYLQRCVGYTLTGDVSEHCLFFLLGPGRNGKSTFIETIRRLVGDYYTKVNADTITLKKLGGGIPNELAALHGMRMVSSSELSKYKHLDEGLIKDVTGGDEVRARFLYQEGFTFSAGFKLWLYGNEKPRISGTDDGIWRRVRLIPWPVQIPEDQVDKHLKERLQLELPGILTWAVKGCVSWLRHGLGDPAVVTDAGKGYREEQDTLGEFLETHCIIGDGYVCSRKDLFTKYREWAKELDEKHPLSAQFFTADIGSRAGIFKGLNHQGIRVWRGITLKGSVEMENAHTLHTHEDPVLENPQKSLLHEDSFPKQVSEVYAVYAGENSDDERDWE